MRLTMKNIKYIIIAVVVICVIETAFMVKRNFSSNQSESDTVEESSSIDDISDEDIEEILNRKLIIKPLEDDFKIIQPVKNEYTTGEDFITFTGMSDPGETLKINDEDIDVYYTGNFAFKRPLDIGENTFTFTLGDKSSTYTINRVNGIIDYITPGETLKADINMKAEIKAKIYSGAEAYAMLGNTKINLVQSESSEELSKKGTCYAEYKGYLDTSKYSAGESLGKIKVYASLNGCEAEKEGPLVTINSEEDEKEIAVINTESAAVYDNKTTSSVPLNDVYPLAKGTKDYIKSKIKCDNKEYYNLGSGKRVKAEDVTVSSYEDLTNTINSLNVSEDGDYAYIKLGESVRSPYTFITENVNYNNKEEEDYEVSKFTTNEIKIYLDYTDNINNNVSYLNNDFFSSVTFEEDNRGKYLSVKLKDNTSYNGHLAYYDNEGNLVFRFLKKKKNLKDMKIVIDPGHGLIAEDKTDLGAYGYSNINENILDMKIAKKLYNALKDEGCESIVLDTDKTPYASNERGRQAKKYDADLFISIHMNSGGVSGLDGVETYYFTPYSKVFAENINKNIAKCYKNELFTDEDKKFNGGYTYNNLAVTLERENPSIFVKIGYIDNPVVFNKLIDESMEIKIAKYIVKGIKESIK